MDLKSMRCALAVAEHESFSLAASSLQLAQSTVSEHIAKLEDEIGSPIFERTSRSVTTTASGRRFLARAGEILESTDQLLLDFQLRPSEPSSLSIGTISGSEIPFLNSVLASFVEIYPKVKLNIVRQVSSRTIEQVERKELDVGLVGVQPSREIPSLRARPIWSDTMLLALPVDHRLATSASVHPADLQAETQVDFPTGTGSRRESDRVFERAGLQRNIAIASNDGQLLLGLVAAGVGVAVLPASLIKSSSAITATALEGAGDREVYLITRSSEPSPIVRTFSRLLAAQAERARS